MAARSRRSVASGCVSEDIAEDVQMSDDQDEDEIDAGSVRCKMDARRRRGAAKGTRPFVDAKKSSVR